MDFTHNAYRMDAVSAESFSRVEQLTPRQLEVLDLLCEGLPNKAIGKRLDIACGTVKVHVANLLRALNVSKRSEAAVVARAFRLDQNAETVKSVEHWQSGRSPYVGDNFFQSGDVRNE